MSKDWVKIQSKNDVSGTSRHGPNVSYLPKRCGKSFTQLPESGIQTNRRLYPRK